MTEIAGFLSGLAKAAVGRELATRWVQVLVSIAAMATCAGVLSAWEFPSQTLGAAVGFIGLDVAEAATSVHNWFIDPIRADALSTAASWVAWGVLSVAFWVHAKQQDDRHWTSSMLSAQTDSDVRRFLRCAMTFVVCLVVLAEIHGVPQPNGILWTVVGLVLGLAGMLLLALAVTASAVLFDRVSNIGDAEDYGPREVLAVAGYGFLFMAGLTMMTVLFVPLRLFFLLTTTPRKATSKADNPDDQ